MANSGKRELRRSASASDRGRRLENQNTLARRSQRHRSNEPVRSRTDNDGVKHGASLRAGVVSLQSSVVSQIQNGHSSDTRRFLCNFRLVPGAWCLVPDL